MSVVALARGVRQPLGAGALALTLVVGGRIGFGAVAAMATPGPLLDPWHHDDAVYFQAIALHGYTAGSTAAFLPLYPLLEAIVAHLGVSVAVGGLMISTVALAVALVLLHRLALPGLGGLASLLLITAPPAVFLFAAYSESLFLVLVLATFLLYRDGRLGWAGITAALAVLTRDQGVLLAPALALPFILRGPWRERAALAKLGGPSLAALAAIVLSWERMHLGSGPWAWEWIWGEHLSLPWATIAHAAQMISRGDGEEILSLGAVILAAVTLPWVWRHLGMAMGLFQAGNIALIVSHQAQYLALMSADRYVLVLPGVLIALAAWLAQRSPVLRCVLLAASCAVALGVSAQFFVGHIFVG